MDLFFVWIDANNTGLNKGGMKKNVHGHHNKAMKMIKQSHTCLTFHRIPSHFTTQYSGSVLCALNEVAAKLFSPSFWIHVHQLFECRKFLTMCRGKHRNVLSAKRPLQSKLWSFENTTSLIGAMSVINGLGGPNGKRLKNVKLIP